MSSKSIRPMWKQWIRAIAGIAIIAVPFLGLTNTMLVWTLVVMGTVVIALSLWGVEEVPSEESGRLQRQYARVAHDGKRSHA